MKVFNENQSEELEKIKKRFDVFYDFLLEKGTSEVYLNMAKDITYKAFKSNSLSKLKKINKELDVWLREMPEEEQVELKQILKEKLGEDTEKAEKDWLDKINKILKRGIINNIKEYALIHDRVEKIYADDSKEEEVKKLNELLADYHRKTDKKLQ